MALIEERRNPKVSVQRIDGDKICLMYFLAFSLDTDELNLQLLISQKASQVVWYSHLFQNVLQFVVIHTVKGFSIVSKAEVFWNSLALSMTQRMLAI